MNRNPHLLPMCVLKVLPMCVPAAHPSPLPRGEGNATNATQAFELSKHRPEPLPLPGGEGWGEGEPTYDFCQRRLSFGNSIGFQLLASQIPPVGVTGQT